MQAEGPDSRRVQRMFADIAHRYDFLNHFLSVSVDKHWRRLAVERVQQLMVRSADTACLDICSGTGDLALELHRRLQVPVVSSDFCHPMLTRSHAKIASAGFSRAMPTIEADALRLPFADGAFDAATNGFGLRNLEDPRQGLLEVLRVLKPGGVVVILEFSKPVIPGFREVFNFYFRRVLPCLGAVISGKASAYQYLPDSVRAFPSQDALKEMMREAGFTDVGYRNLSGGIAALHWGRKFPS